MNVVVNRFRSSLETRNVLSKNIWTAFRVLIMDCDSKMQCYVVRQNFWTSTHPGHWTRSFDSMEWLPLGFSKISLLRVIITAKPAPDAVTASSPSMSSTSIESSEIPSSRKLLRCKNRIAWDFRQSSLSTTASWGPWRWDSHEPCHRYHQAAWGMTFWGKKGIGDEQIGIICGVDGSRKSQSFRQQHRWTNDQ
jgi:hypothetical protein